MTHHRDTTTWTPDDLARIGDADEVQITTASGDGTLRAWVPIWVVRVGDEVYVRSYRGVGGAWYRHASTELEGRIRAGGVERAVTFDRAADTTTAGINDAYRAKYARYGDTYLRPMLTADAVAATLRLHPQT